MIYEKVIYSDFAAFLKEKAKVAGFEISTIGDSFTDRVGEWSDEKHMVSCHVFIMSCGRLSFTVTVISGDDDHWDHVVKKVTFQEWDDLEEHDSWTSSSSWDDLEDMVFRFMF